VVGEEWVDYEYAFVAFVILLRFGLDGVLDLYLDIHLASDIINHRAVSIKKRRFWHIY
jgi:hypothetical protein